MKKVAPFTGAWIEIITGCHYLFIIRVAPFTGAWIEMLLETQTDTHVLGRPLHGGVD